MNKDVDMMRDTGGQFRHKELKKPSRIDRKKPRVDKSDPDFADTSRDPDLRKANARVARELVRLARELVAYNAYDRRLCEMFEWALSRLGGRLAGHPVSEIVADVEEWSRGKDPGLEELHGVFREKYPDAWKAIADAFDDAWRRYCGIAGEEAWR